MATSRPPDRFDPPSDVQITVTFDGGHGALNGLRAVARAHRAALAVAALVAIVAIAAAEIAPSAGRPRAASTGSRAVVPPPIAARLAAAAGVRSRIALAADVTPRTAGAAGVAAAYRYSLGCLSVTIAGGYAAARLNRASPCWRYGVYVTTIFHRVRGVWRLVREASSRWCPPHSLPPAVRAQLAVCTQSPQ
jgi:hypothetical protein